uniref:COG4196 Uncharacterized protein conserved in bacteria n=1 Tax=uncultured bacterium B3TF_MPn1 TaxID=1439866 RepID=W0NU29_9BACT|nr:COG4196 Uncharacterized protein conserved in bacteria [uncultured bacterium B3TF_MPn1]
MTMRVLIKHSTHYKFDRDVVLSPHTIRLRPAPHCRTPIESYSLKVSPNEHFINWQLDPFSNHLARLVFPEKAKELSIDVEVIARLEVINPFDFFIEDYAEHYPFQYSLSDARSLQAYLQIAEKGEALINWVSELQVPEEITSAQFLFHINKLLAEQIKYNTRMEPGVQTCEETLQKASGSCRDTAWLLVQICRHLGLAARFVSGYLVQLKADEKSLDGPSGPEKDFTDLHAWVEVYLPGAGWIGLDPTSGLFAGEGHIPLAATPEPASAAPIEGEVETCEVDFSFSNSVERIGEEPRITKPYSAEDWSHADALGHAVQAELDMKGIKMTMGGEPTFISIDDMESPEWNTAADGDHKRQKALTLFSKMSEHYASAPLQHFGQGKWYPGEPLPRWQYACFWHNDGSAFWKNNDLLGAPGASYGYSLEEIASYSKLLTATLGVSDKCLQGAYEDIYYLMWQAGTLPVGTKPKEVTLGEDDERNTLFDTIDRALHKESRGFVLPLAWAFKSNRWQSCQWEFRRERCYLVPGDSPIGYRLPLDSISWVPIDQREQHAETSLFEKRHSLQNNFEFYEDINPQENFVQTALCIELRRGAMYVFMPPLTDLEHYCDLVSRIEYCCEQLKMKVIIEGYAPPRDPRITQFMVTPDPGVIEVNIHPSPDWKSLVENTTHLYRLAKHSRLGTSKYTLDGTQTGTGGGCHVTIGGKTTDESPLLKRPSLLRSLITFWQHHPGLSYLFSGQFIGPTSQAPRVDEARDELLYELEIAFSQIPDGDVEQPWLADRLLRNLLVDLTGNTHRAEFCIDKLYSPDSATGRLGILEFRGFEMPPHEQMNLVQMLLLRTLVARFWDKPYKHKLVRWGTQLHDKFMLPHFVWEDIRDVCNTLQTDGYPMRLAWFKPFLEFRFPIYGSHIVKGMKIELRQAIEPWNVLGEEVSQSGTSRFVDSSLERLQIKLSDFVPERYVVTCNRRKIQMTSTGKEGEFVAGVRYRAWQPPSALHPLLKINSPLIFDIVDTWNGKTIGGCSYHVSHPGGRSYEIFPVNSNEAEGRRINRFYSIGHSIPSPKDSGYGQLNLHSAGIFYPKGSIPGEVLPIDEAPKPQYSVTLDLRMPMTNEAQ